MSTVPKDQWGNSYSLENVRFYDAYGPPQQISAVHFSGLFTSVMLRWVPDYRNHPEELKEAWDYMQSLARCDVTIAKSKGLGGADLHAMQVGISEGLAITHGYFNRITQLNLTRLDSAEAPTWVIPSRKRRDEWTKTQYGHTEYNIRDMLILLLYQWTVDGETLRFPETPEGDAARARHRKLVRAQHPSRANLSLEARERMADEYLYSLPRVPTSESRLAPIERKTLAWQNIEWCVRQLIKHAQRSGRDSYDRLAAIAKALVLLMKDPNTRALQLTLDTWSWSTFGALWVVHKELMLTLDKTQARVLGWEAIERMIKDRQYRLADRVLEYIRTGHPTLKIRPGKNPESVTIKNILEGLWDPNDTGVLRSHCAVFTGHLDEKASKKCPPALKQVVANYRRAYADMMSEYNDIDYQRNPASQAQGSNCGCGQCKVARARWAEREIWED
jgi:hypothetical protein